LPAVDAQKKSALASAIERNQKLHGHTMFAQETAASALARPLSAAEQQWLAAHSLIGIVVRLTPEMAALANAESLRIAFSERI
jgi:hypothetical protein